MCITEAIRKFLNTLRTKESLFNTATYKCSYFARRQLSNLRCVLQHMFKEQQQYNIFPNKHRNVSLEMGLKVEKFLTGRSLILE